MHKLIAIALLALAGCAATPGAQGPRDAGAQISSAALFDPARFVDVWHVVATYGDEARCGPLAETWTATGPGRYRVTGTACGPSGSRAFVTTARVTGPGRITLDGPGQGRQIWVLWVDGDYRVAAIGSPSGDVGRIISRSPQARGDLMAAAREVLEFNGYDLRGLRGL